MKILQMLILAAVLTSSLYALDKVTITPDKSTHCYKLGEDAVFTIAAFEKGKPVSSGKYQADFYFCGYKSMKKVPVDFAAGNPARVTCRMTQPGFILLKFLDEKGNRVKINKKDVLAGVAFSPEKIRKGYAMPKDFFAFWENGRKQIANTPVQLVKDQKRSDAKHTVYAVSVKSLNNETISGYLRVPTGKGPFPAYVGVPGAGPGVCGPYILDGVITLAMNVHKFPTADNPAEQKRRYAEDQKRDYYPQRDAGDRDTYFFRSVYVGMDRLINYVAAMKEWDHKHMVIAGSSQGGGSALILAGFNKNITAVCANVPALCDHGGYKMGRAPGWPNLYKTPNTDQFAPYFDAAVFASQIKVPTVICCGFIDTTCPPSSVYAAYNELKGPKKMGHVVLEGHTWSKLFSQEFAAFKKKYLGR